MIFFYCLAWTSHQKNEMSQKNKTKQKQGNNWLTMKHGRQDEICVPSLLLLHTSNIVTADVYC